MKKFFKVNLEINMDASNRLEIIVHTNNEKNAEKLAIKKAEKDKKVRFVNVINIEKI